MQHVARAPLQFSNNSKSPKEIAELYENQLEQPSGLSERQPLSLQNTEKTKSAQIYNSDFRDQSI
jgi:hypothetical protein